MSDRQIAVITGGSAGVGRATVKAFAERGFDVAILARGDAGLQGAAKDVVEAGRKSLAICTDVSQFDQVDAAATRVENELGPVDVWVNDAMTTVFAPAWDVKPADFQRAVEVTFLGQVWGTMAALSRMRPRDRGSIVNVGSALAFIGIPLQAAYCSSKFACRGFFESVRAELLHEGSQIRLSMVHLPAVNTPQFDWCETTLDHHPQPVPPIYQPEVPARYILEAAISGRPSKVVGSWNKLLVAAGQVFPRLGNQYAALGAWDTQLTSQTMSPDRPSNLHHPMDAQCDHGAHGAFDDKAGGFLDPTFLKSLPATARTFVTAVVRTAAEKRKVDIPPSSPNDQSKAAAVASSETEPTAVQATRAPNRRTQPERRTRPSLPSSETTKNGELSAPPQARATSSSQSDDALDLWGQEIQLLERLFDGWAASDPSAAEQPVEAAWDHGTIGKLLIREAAILLAAEEDVAGVLGKVGKDDICSDLTKHTDAARKALDHLDECCRGMPGIELTTPDILEAVVELRQRLLGEPLADERTVSELAALLGEDRDQLRSAKYLRKHAPTHPGPTYWYKHIPVAVRAKVLFDRLSDFPGPDSTINDKKLVDRYLETR